MDEPSERVSRNRIRRQFCLNIAPAGGEIASNFSVLPRLVRTIRRSDSLTPWTEYSFAQPKSSPNSCSRLTASREQCSVEPAMPADGTRMFPLDAA